MVVQKTENGNHYAILSKQQKKVNLSKVMALIRLREAELQGIDLPVSEQELEQIRTIEHIPNWYYDPATNSLLNGGPHNRTIAESKIPWEEMLKIVPLGIRLGTPYSESPNFICDGKTYEYGRAYLMLPLAVSGLPSTISVEGLDLHLKSDFHVTLLCVKNLIRKYGPKIEDKILRLFCSFIRQHPITFVRFTGEYRFAETNNRKSVVALCEVANLDAFFTLAKKELHISLPFQPTHVTLYTLQPGAGIGLNSETEMEQMSHPVNLPNEIGYTLAKGGKA